MKAKITNASGNPALFAGGFGQKRIAAGATETMDLAAEDVALARDFFGSDAVEIIDGGPEPEATASTGQGEERAERVKVALRLLNPDDPSHFTKSDKPRIPILEAATLYTDLGRDEVDELWAEVGG